MLFSPLDATHHEPIPAHKHEMVHRYVENKDLDFWAKEARDSITWYTPFTRTFDGSKAPFYKWFYDGSLNVSYNCLDRHLPTKAQKAALIFESDEGRVTTVTYQELYERVCQFANGLLSLGIKTGDRVVIYMPMSIEAIVAMQACARLGVIHSVVFGGFSAKSLYERILDASAVAVITADAGIRGGKKVLLKNAVDEALAMGTTTVEKVIVYQRALNTITWDAQRDIWWHDLISSMPKECAPVWVNAEHPLFILYTSGSTGKPKGVQHSSAGYLLGSIMTMRHSFDIKDTDVFWCTADVGWITGHTYVAYGPLACGGTEFIFEGIPTYPHAGRFWELIEKHKITTFYTAPTAIRSLIKADSHAPNNYDLSSLRLLGSVGEPINPEAWHWYNTVVGKEKCPIIDTWWQTETGAHMIAPHMSEKNLKPGSCMTPLPGIAVDIDREGRLVITKPFPSLLRTLWNAPERFKETYFPEELGGTTYLAGDFARKDDDGHYWILGRIDDVLNVSGHRLGTAEIESALVAHPAVAEAAVVGKPHAIKGEAVVAFVVLKGTTIIGEQAQKMAQELREWIAKEIGAHAKPEEIRFGDNLPKTRSGKIMRRLLKDSARGQRCVQDTTTLENPAILEQLQHSGY